MQTGEISLIGLDVILVGLDAISNPSLNLEQAQGKPSMILDFSNMLARYCRPLCRHYLNHTLQIFKNIHFLTEN